MKNDRLFAITNILLHKKSVTASMLAKEFDVSIRTIYRDIETLSANGVPVYCSQGKGGGISLMGHYSIDKAILSDAEQNEVLTALKGAQVTGQMNLKNSISKLSGLFQKDITDWIEIDFTGWSQNSSDGEVFQTIRNSIVNTTLLTFTYYNSKGIESTRTVLPYKLIFKGTQWYLYAFCQEKQDYRFFKLNRMKNLQSSNETFLKENDVKIIPSYKEETDGETIQLTLKINKSIAFRVYDEFKNASFEEQDDYIIAKVEWPFNEWLISYLLGYGKNIEILEPTYFRELFKKEVEKIYSLYL